ncbi:MAG: adenylate kinase [Patescibacteria group bacterium]|jgi:adenylate kinase
MNVVIFGSPGAGKGTQAQLLARANNLSHLSSGELSRQLLGDKVLGEQLKRYLSSGRLIPNKIIIKIVEDHIEKNKRVAGFIFDGYPRTLGQARELDRLAKRSQTEIHLVINLQLSQSEALKRILLRGKRSGRADDNITTVKTRLQVYQRETKPVLDYYRQQGKLITIDGRPAIKEIAQKIQKLFEQRLASLNK